MKTVHRSFHKVATSHNSILVCVCVCEYVVVVVVVGLFVCLVGVFFAFFFWGGGA